MRRETAIASDVERDAPIQLVGGIDQQGIDALADLLIAAAKRRQEYGHDSTSDGIEETEHDCLEAG